MFFFFISTMCICAKLPENPVHVFLNDNKRWVAGWTHFSTSFQWLMSLIWHQCTLKNKVKEGDTEKHTHVYLLLICLVLTRRLKWNIISLPLLCCRQIELYKKKDKSKISPGHHKRWEKLLLFPMPFKVLIYIKYFESSCWVYKL